MSKTFWNRLKVNWYRRGAATSDFAKKVLPVILKNALDAKTFLDVGCGCGALTIPLAKKAKLVTALDPSLHMMDALKDELKKGKIKNVKTVNAAWRETTLKPHDAVICANVPELLKDDASFLKDADSIAKKAVFLVAGADPLADKFYYKELFPLVFRKTFEPRSDYLKTYSMLHSLGIYANVEIINYDFDQPFTGMDEALEFWKEYMGIVTGEHDATLRDFLEKKLVKTKTGLIARFPKKSAVMWWRK
ncbi:MAG: methyltransferase domain-containing protein [Deltaproteobacteria bacterium]|nr:methyltransferase domain-containing protein [Deltaproteobacteria bacterium]